jgi:hypothetical protein
VQVGHGGGAVVGCPRLAVELIRTFEEDHGNSMFLKEESEQQAGRTSTYNEDLRCVRPDLFKGC